MDDSSIGVYRSSDSKLIGTYEYDLWGKLISVKEASSGIDTNGILKKNPFRYRGYYYDNETGFYYLQSRYYDPQIVRWISKDSIIGVDDFLGHNLFVYCDNNPVNKVDCTGRDGSYIELGSGTIMIKASPFSKILCVTIQKWEYNIAMLMELLFFKRTVHL